MNNDKASFQSTIGYVLAILLVDLAAYLLLGSSVSLLVVSIVAILLFITQSLFALDKLTLSIVLLALIILDISLLVVTHTFQFGKHFTPNGVVLVMVALRCGALDELMK